jgi:hypothetical protein
MESIAIFLTICLVLAAACGYLFFLRDNDQEESVDNEYSFLPADPEMTQSMYYEQEIYFEQHSLFEDDRWVWIGAIDCEPVHMTEPPVFVDRDMSGPDSFDSQKGSLNPGWRELVENIWGSEATVYMVAANNVEVGFRLPDGLSDEKLTDFGDNVLELLAENQPCK